MKLEDCFDNKGDFVKNFDPYRKKDNDPEYMKIYDFLFEDLKIYNFLFEDSGYDTYFRDELYNELIELLNSKGYPFDSDAVSLFHAEEFSSKTKGNYSVLDYWR